jgi:hypothetical protein
MSETLKATARRLVAEAQRLRQNPTPASQANEVKRFLDAHGGFKGLVQSDPELSAASDQVVSALERALARPHSPVRPDEPGDQAKARQWHSALAALAASSRRRATSLSPAGKISP